MGQTSMSECFNDWYNEINSCSPATDPENCGGHFTQIVWKT